MGIFSGSYLASDVEFLLKPITIRNTPVAEKEQLIQSGKKHYSEMISEEILPSADYLRLFYQIFSQNKQRLATDLLILASKIHHNKPHDITLVSLARAGTPIGVLLKRVLQQYFQRDCQHYSISIIRDRGIDSNALRYILNQHDPSSVTFIDGWTGKGVITQELAHSINEFNQRYPSTLCADLYVLNDIAGVAAVTASFEDYLIPSSLLNATISGLISRSILNTDYITQQDFHGCVYHSEFAAQDLSQWFITETMKTIAQVFNSEFTYHVSDINTKQQVQQQSRSFIVQLKTRYQIKNVNLIKPGIGEATRVLLRRIPDLLILKNKQAQETQHLALLAREKNIPIVENLTMPYQAVSIIAELTS
jgi:hypothetical protein